MFNASKVYIERFKSNRIVLAKYLFFLIKNAILSPFRIFNSDEADLAKYRKFTKGKKEIILDIAGSKMVLPVADEGLSRELFSAGIREKDVFEVVKRELKAGMNVVDIGANLGYYVLIESKKANKIYGIEPNPLAFTYLKRNVKLNKIKNVKLMNLAIGSSKSILPFYISKNWNWSRFEKGDKGDDILSIKNIKIDTLDSLFKKEKVDLLRMDVEGFELEIFKGAKKFIKRNPSLMILLEFHADVLSPSQREEFINICRECGLKIKYFFKKDTWPDKPFSKNFNAVRNSSITAYQMLLVKG